MIKICQFCGNEFKTPYQKAKFCGNECKFAWQRKDKPSNEWLYQKYIVEGLTAKEIAKIVKRNDKRVWEWLRDARIPTRPRGHNVSEFRKGKPSTFKGKKHTEENKQAQRERRLRDGHVPYLKNGVHWLKGRKGDASPNYKGGITPERQAFYGTPEWKKTAGLVWRRDRATCQRCGIQKYNEEGIPLDIHHITSFAVKELRLELSNLILLCEKCHYWVHSRKNINKEFIKEHG
jgi:5-methylcytosine-specific restriction endonuclease McrA